MFTDNKDFYPTPQKLIEKMVSGVDLTMIHSILEPSAGSGAIVDYLMEKQEQRNRWEKYIDLSIDCIEIDNDLRNVLKGKNHRVVWDDFMTYETQKEYDIIVANPPFGNGAKHLIKMLDMQARNGGAVICLLNAETIKNQCSNDRIELNRRLQEYNATIEFISGAFTDADRKTDVETALVKVQLPEVKRHSFIMDGLQKAQEEKEVEAEATGSLIEGDFFKAIINQYNVEIEAGKKLIEEYRAMQPYILGSFGKDKETGKTIQTGGCILDMTVAPGGYSTSRTSYLSVNGFIKEVRRKYWKALFENPKFSGQLTNNLQREYSNRIEELSNYEFNMFNITQIKVDMQKSVVKGIEETIISLFDELSHKHHYYDETSKNIHYYNGWKTNKSWIINDKVIIPLNGYHDLAFSWGGFKPTTRSVVDKLQDMEKCFNYLDGGLTDAVDLDEALQFAEEYEETKDIQLKYFTVTFYKKGTCHIRFTNPELLKKFNIFGSQHKGWLPPSYGKKDYKDMTAEEKSVIDDFEGEKSYNVVRNNSTYYLFDGNKINLLEVS